MNEAARQRTHPKTQAYVYVKDALEKRGMPMSRSLIESVIKIVVTKPSDKDRT